MNRLVNVILKMFFIAVLLIVFNACAKNESLRENQANCLIPPPMEGAREVNVEDQERQVLETFLQQNGLYDIFITALDSGKWLKYQMRSPSGKGGYEVWVVERKVWTKTEREKNTDQWQLKPGALAVYAQTFCEKHNRDSSEPLRWVTDQIK